MKNKKVGPFDHVKQIYKSTNEYLGDEGYAPFIINKELSKNPDLIELVNYVQQFQLPNKLHAKVLGDFAQHTTAPKWNQFPWIWGKQTKSDATTEVVARHFQVSLSEAQEYIILLKRSEDGKSELKRLQQIYGLKNQK